MNRDPDRLDVYPCFEDTTECGRRAADGAVWADLGSDDETGADDEYFVRCPKCGKEFDSRETFDWAPDLHGDPTIEQIYCPHCGAGTSPKKTCSDCEERDICALEESCEDTRTFAFEAFVPSRCAGGDTR